MRTKNIRIALITLCVVTGAIASDQPGNPILKLGDPGFLYTADPAAEVFDGKVYVYCSHDQPDAKNFKGMQDYIVLESPDLKTWINHGVVLKPREFSWASGQMNAPDAAYKDGWYYFYFPYDKTHIGVAKSQTPIGPWSEAVKGKIGTIFDPCVFVDVDGQAYIYGNDHKVDIGDKGWHVMGARLKPNMIELDGPWQRLSKEEVNEAVSVFKRNGKYYFMARKDKKTVYFMADSPLPTKPYATFKGAVTEDINGAPAHTSAIEFQGQWYLFYHLGSEVNKGSFFRRSVCFDKMEFNEDGTIRPVLFTLGKGVGVRDEIIPTADSFWTLHEERPISCEGFGERARPRAHRHAPSRGDWKKISGHVPLEIPNFGRGAHLTAPEAGALPGTGRYRASFQKSKRKGNFV